MIADYVGMLINPVRREGIRAEEADVRDLRRRETRGDAGGAQTRRLRLNKEKPRRVRLGAECTGAPIRRPERKPLTGRESASRAKRELGFYAHGQEN